MRHLKVFALPFAIAAALAAAIATAPVAVADEEVSAATLEAVIALATRDHPEPATVRNVRKSRAMNGQGYCGEVSFTAGDDYAAFHAILQSGSGPSVLLLSDYPEADQSPNAVVVRQMMRNFGCIE